MTGHGAVAPPADLEAIMVNGGLSTLAASSWHAETSREREVLEHCSWPENYGLRNHGFGNHGFGKHGFGNWSEAEAGELKRLQP